MANLRPVVIVWLRRFALAGGFAIVAAGALMVFDSYRETTVLRIPVPDRSEETVDFVLRRAFNGERGYILRCFHVSGNYSEDKVPFVPADVSIADVQAAGRIERSGRSLIVYGPQGRRTEWLGYYE